MNSLFGQQQQQTAYLQQQQQSAMVMMQAEFEMDMMTDLFNSMLNTCHKKCIPPKYADGELNKGESVCIDRCVAKYVDIFQRVGKKLSALSGQEVPQ